MPKLFGALNGVFYIYIGQKYNETILFAAAQNFAITLLRKESILHFKTG